MTTRPDKAAWQEARKEYIGGSEVAGLFGLHRRHTKFSLYHLKRGNIPEDDFSDDDRVFWGENLEEAIIAGAAKRHGWQVKELQAFAQHPEVARMASNMDSIISMPGRHGDGYLEIKMVDNLEFSQKWGGAPLIGYELQLQHGLACSGLSWGCIGVLVGGNDFRPFYREARPGTILALEREVSAFWQAFDAGEEPQPDFERDARTISAIYRQSAGFISDRAGDDYLNSLVAQYEEITETSTAARKKRDAIRAEILTIIGSAEEIILADGRRLHAKTRLEAPVAYLRKGYRDVRLPKK